MNHPIVAVIGAGQVGATTAQRLIEKDIANVVIFDIADGLAEGKALDLMQAAPVEGHSKQVSGTNDIAGIKDADIVVVTAGLPRKPGMSRDDLLTSNAGIVQSVCKGIKEHAPNSIVITVTNPLDIMTDLAAKLLGFPKSRVFGMAGVLDAARMRYFVAEELGVEPHRVTAMVLGGHGDAMVPVTSSMQCDGKPITSISADKLQAIIERTQNGGAEIVKHLKTGSAFYAPASSVAEMVAAVLGDKAAVLPVCAHCDGEYGIEKMYCGVPAKLGRQGIMEIIQMDLSETEKDMLRSSASKVAEGVNQLESLIK
ncbi:MAG: malate dehydrogenase [Candidatus Omnitrophota bacterium]|jgi:malate dehydrogenase